jgi:hypothetical protein
VRSEERERERERERYAVVLKDGWHGGDRSTREETSVSRRRICGGAGGLMTPPPECEREREGVVEAE